MLTALTNTSSLEFHTIANGIVPMLAECTSTAAGRSVQTALRKTSGLESRTIAPLHGLLLAVSILTTATGLC